MKIKDQLANILTKALGSVKFVELCVRNGVKKAWDEKKIKEENDGSDFPSQRMIGAHGTIVACKREHLARPCSAHSAGIVAPVEMVPSGTQW